jgi:hypothetical protein
MCISQLRNDCLHFELFSLYGSVLFCNPESHQATTDITTLATVQSAKPENQ